MAIGDPYATKDDLKAYLGITSAAADAVLDDAVQAASRKIDECTDRHFNKDSVATPRLFTPQTPFEVQLDDIADITGMTVELDSGRSGNFDVTLAPTDYELEPINGLINGQQWAYERLRSVNGYWLPTPLFTRRSKTIRVTAIWGWPVVPPPIKRATLILAAQMYKLKDAPFGVAGMAEFGVVRVRDVPLVEGLIKGYALDPMKVG